MSEQEPAKQSGIEEVSACLDFLTSCLQDLTNAKKGDGHISLIEWGQMVIKNAPKGFTAIKGVDLIGLELGDLDENEVKEISDKLLALAAAGMGLVLPKAA